MSNERPRRVSWEEFKKKYDAKDQLGVQWIAFTENEHYIEYLEKELFSLREQIFYASKIRGVRNE